MSAVEDLAAWLTAVWDEEERLASDDLTPGPWTLEYECPEGEHDHDWDEVWIAGHHRSTVAGFNERYTCAPRDAAHIVRQQPASVLARIAADRKILADYQRLLFDDPLRRTDYFRGQRDALEYVVKHKAEQYADREGFRSEWLVERQGVER